MSLYGLMAGGVAIGLDVASRPYYRDGIDGLAWVGIGGSILLGGLAGLVSGLVMMFLTQTSFADESAIHKPFAYRAVNAVVMLIVTGVVISPIFPNTHSPYSQDIWRVIFCLMLALIVSQLAATGYLRDLR